MGLKRCIEKVFGGDKGATIIASMEKVAQFDKQLPPLPPMNDAGDAGPGDLEGPGAGPKPGPRMNIDEKVADGLQDGKKKERSPFVDLLVDVIAPIVVKDRAWSVEDVIAELGKLGKGEETLEVFKGKLSKKVEELQKKKGGDSEKKKEEKDEDKGEKKEPKEEKEEGEEKGEKKPPFPPKGEEKKASAISPEVLAAINGIAEVMPAVVAALRDADEAKTKLAAAEDKDHTRIRSVKTRQIAERMAKLNMIKAEDVDGYAGGLANATDDEVNGVLKTIELAEESAPKIAEAIARKTDRKVEALAGGRPVIASIPAVSADRTEEGLKFPGRSTNDGRYIKGGLSWSSAPKVDESQKH
jgi:hypothetical protein